jgi:hypothetical protein
MIIRLTNAERDTILAALRRWQSFPAAREADAVATNGGKHRPLDNAEIERICKRMTRNETKRNAAPSRRQSGNGAHEHKASKTAKRIALQAKSCLRLPRHCQPGQLIQNQLVRGRDVG